MGIMGMIGGNRFGNLLNNKQAPFQQVYNLTNFGITANVTLDDNDFKKVGTVTVSPQEEVNYGYGNDDRPDNQGHVYFRIDHTDGVQIHGLVRFVVADNKGLTKDVIVELRTENLSGSQTNKEQMIPLPEKLAARMGIAKENDKLELYFKADDESKTLDYDGTNTKILIPMSIYSVPR